MKKKWKPHPLVKKLYPDPQCPPPDLVVLTGYLGPSGHKGYYRVYSRLDFKCYTEIPKEAIKHVEPLDPDNEERPSRIVVKAGTEVQTVQSVKHDLVADYLGGNIADTCLGDAMKAAHPSHAECTGNRITLATVDDSRPLSCCDH